MHWFVHCGTDAGHLTEIGISVGCTLGLLEMVRCLGAVLFAHAIQRYISDVLTVYKS